MNSPQYALVAYVRNPVGEFAENLRRELHPEHPELAAHVTILPPRQLSGTETEAMEVIENVCKNVAPFEITMGDVESFIPTTPTIFIRVAHAAYKVRELHDSLNTGPLQYDEPWPYMPHLTIVKLSDIAAAQQAVNNARKAWEFFPGQRKIMIDELTFVREGRDIYNWYDLAPIRLGASLTPAR